MLKALKAAPLLASRTVWLLLGSKIDVVARKAKDMNLPWTKREIVATTNRRLKGFRMQRKRNLIRGVISAQQQLHQRRRPRISNSG